MMRVNGLITAARTTLVVSSSSSSSLVARPDTAAVKPAVAKAAEISAVAAPFQSSSLRGFYSKANVTNGVLCAKGRQFQQYQQQHNRRSLSFSFAGPRHLTDLLQTEKLHDASGETVADLWRHYHADKEHALGLVLTGRQGMTILERATKSPFCTQAVPRDAGHFVLIAQCQAPCHFLVTYLHAYQQNPSTATPWLTFTLFTEYSGNDGNDNGKDVTLVRGDVMNTANLTKADAERIVHAILYSYEHDHDTVYAMNHEPAQFDVNDTISRMNARWMSKD